MRSALVVGTGLIGTSLALALSRRGVDVYLSDADESAARTAASLGAGRAVLPSQPVDLAVLAVPPARIAEVLAKGQQEDWARVFTDVGSVKARLHDAAAVAGADLSRFIGGHPLAGRERSGPLAGRADLFEGRPWVLTPGPTTSRDALNQALELVSLCGAVPVVMDTDEHDHAVALISHAPHLVAALMAARLENAREESVRISGTGIRDLTRIAGGAPELWEDILAANAPAIAEVLAAYADDLTAAVQALHAVAGPDAEAAKRGAADLADLLRRGNAGHARIPGKHGATSASYAVVPVLISDRPGELARLFAAAGSAGVNIEDVRIDHSPGREAGLVELLVDPTVADRFATSLGAAGWTVQA
ncbi:prephenate dehydrogenase [Catenulispora yoronensis]|uniref:Prephenate dehydrogenase n=1 Tax=Catenulispora yoronensis TaxID=450799 RepID=A0ABP5GU42_9ACTN